VLCIFLSLRKWLKKHSQNTSIKLQNTRKTPKNCFFLQKNRRKHHKTPAKHPQNTAEHHKTHKETKQTELANKPLRSPLNHTWDTALHPRLNIPIGLLEKELEPFEPHLLFLLLARRDAKQKRD